jgi:predicted nucleotidyltransferase
VTVHEVVASKRAQIEALCRRLGVRGLDVFGSALGERFDAETSDVDVLVEFSRGPGFDYFEAYFALKDGLEEILGRPVDLVSATGIRNPYFRDEVMRTREPLYAA